MFFLHKKHLTQKNLYTQTAHRNFYRPTFLHAETLYTQSNFCTTETFSHRCLSAQTNYCIHSRFLPTDGFYTESSPHRSLTHRTYYIILDIYTHVYIYIHAYAHMHGWMDRLIPFFVHANLFFFGGEIVSSRRWFLIVSLLPGARHIFRL